MNITLRLLARQLCALLFSLGLLVLYPAIAPAWAVERSPAPSNAHAYLITPQDGDSVPSNFTVQFGLSGMGVAPAGIDKAGTGHHHLLIDLAELPDLTEPLPATEQIKHFGGGQTETELSLSPGEHTLQLVLGNYSHVPHDKPVMSESITIQVQ